MSEIHELERSAFRELSLEIRELLNCYKGVCRYYRLYHSEEGLRDEVFTSLIIKEERVIRLVNALENLCEIKPEIL